VPNENDNASTVKLEVVVPTQAPIANMSVKPVPGWTAAVEKSKLATPIKTDDGEVTEAVSKITWTASRADSAIKPGRFLEFEVSAGPLPEVDHIVFKSLQTYSDGDVVRWIEEPAADGKEVEHPAPVLKLTKKTAVSPAAAPAAQTGTTPVANTVDTATGLSASASPPSSRRWPPSTSPYSRGAGHALQHRPHWPPSRRDAGYRAGASSCGPVRPTRHTGSQPSSPPAEPTTHTHEEYRSLAIHALHRFAVPCNTCQS
jgi:uncharacterized protein YcnI